MRLEHAESSQETVMAIRRHILAVAALVALTGPLAACGDTWEGLKKDTGENLKKAGSAIEKAGESVSK
jgi:predicted small secreted protein